MNSDLFDFLDCIDDEDIDLDMEIEEWKKDVFKKIVSDNSKRKEKKEKGKQLILKIIGFSKVPRI